MGLDICHCILVEKNKNSVDHHTVEDFENNIEFLDHHREKIISEDSSEIIYYKDIGYIRKQVHEDFLKEYQNNKLYFSKTDVINFKKYLKADNPENQASLEKYFQENFIDNFQENESIFFISY